MSSTAAANRLRAIIKDDAQHRPLPGTDAQADALIAELRNVIADLRQEREDLRKDREVLRKDRDHWREALARRDHSPPCEV